MEQQNRRGPKYDFNGVRARDPVLGDRASTADSSHKDDESSHQKMICQQKSYVTMLDEFCGRQKLTPTYQLISMEGMSHEPTFVYKVQLDGYEAATGRGRRKQDARQSAAKNLLQAMSPGVKLDEDPEEELESQGPPLETSVPITQSTMNSPSAVINHLAASFVSSEVGAQSGSPEKVIAGFFPVAPEQQVEPLDSTANQPINALANQPINALANGPINAEANRPINVVSHPVPACRVENPVGSLQELTLAVRWPPPRFDLCLREGAAHDATFTIACYVWSYKSIGKGKSKKLAKRLAAYNMYEMLRKAPEVLELWQKRAELYAAKASNQRRQKTAPIPQRAPAMQDLHKDLYTSSVQSLSTLRDLPHQTIVQDLPDPLGFLREIATELSFDILFEDLYDLSKVKASVAVRPSDADEISPKLIESHPQSVADKSANAASLIILTISRQIVCFGTGISKAAARKAAVISALLYLQTAAAAPRLEFPLPQSPLKSSTEK